jgi:hypothetical protein
MATGIVSLAVHAMGIPLLVRLIFWLNGAFYGVLWFLTAWALTFFGRLRPIGLGLRASIKHGASHPLP